MTKNIHLFRMALQNLRRGGQRVIVAALCIAFGVMSLAAMSALSDVLAEALLVTPRREIGGDLTLSRPGQEQLTDEHLARLAELEAEGAISAFTPVADTFHLTLRVPGSAHLYFQRGRGVDPARYPLVGDLTLAAPDNTGLATLLAAPGDVLLTRDVAAEMGLAAGDSVILAEQSRGAPLQGRVTGVVADTPDHSGSRVYYNLETAAALTGRAHPADGVLAAAPEATTLATHLEEEGWSAYTTAERRGRNRETQDIFNLFLKGAGILGLLVGGVGVANTMQVLLARRGREMAVLKTVGYGRRDLLLLFVWETAVLGIIGSVIGVVLALGVGRYLVDLFGRITTFLLTWRFGWETAVSSLGVGVLTTVIFAMSAIVRAGNVRPAALLRDEPIKAGRLPKRQTAALLLGLTLPFAVITSLIMGSVIEGVGVLLFALAGLLLVGGVLGGLTWLAARLLPVSRFHLLHMARVNLRRRGLGLVFPLIALFIGVVTLGMGAVVTQGARQEMAAHTIAFDGPALTLRAAAEAETAVAAAAAGHDLENVRWGRETAVSQISFPALDNRRLPPRLIGRGAPADVTVEGAAWGTAAGVYVPARSQIPAGAEATVTLADGQTHTLPVVGSYEPDWRLPTLRNELGLLLPAAQLEALAPAQTITLFADPAGPRRETVAALGEALPQAIVIDNIAYINRYSQQYSNLYAFALAMAGLALLAGVLLVGNAVTLAMLNRRYEIGVLKAVGYTRRHVLTAVALEYSLVAVIAALLGLIAVQIALQVLQMINDQAGSLLRLDWRSALFIFGLSVGLTLLTALAGAWKPTRVTPLVALNAGK